MRLPRLKSTAQVVRRHDQILVLLEGADEDLVLEGAAEQIEALLLALDGRTPVGEIVARVPGANEETVLAAIGELADVAVIDDAAADREFLSESELERFDRQLRYFADIGDCPRGLYQQRLADATVAVLGIGGLGGSVAMTLAACGVGAIVAVDDDVVEESNLARQFLYGEADVGRPKVQVAGDRLCALRSDLTYRSAQCRIRSVGDARRLIRGSDIVVAAVDWPASLIGRWVNDACFELRIPYIAMSQHPPSARIGPLYVPGRTGCFSCQESSYRETYAEYDEILRQTDPASPAATWAPACGLIGALVANDVMAYLTGLHTPAAQGQAHLVDLRTLSVNTESVPRRTDCMTCNGAQ